MSFKPTHSSVTDVPCTCSYLPSAADDPNNPIAFDQQTGEFQFRYTRGKAADSDPGVLIIYHCPFCGGTAPKSKRNLLFARIPDDEVGRIAELLAPIQTLADALRILGPPDADDHGTSRCLETDDQPSSVERFRQIRYESLSTVADVSFQIMADSTVHWQLFGKPL